MFKLGIYKAQLNIIAVLLMFLCLGQLASCVDKAFATEEVKTKVAPVTHNDYIPAVNTDLDYGPDSDMREWMLDYQMEIQDNGNKIVLYDGKKVVHVFDRAYPGNKNLFNVIDRDNW